MKVNVRPHKVITQKHFFLLMVVPLLIGTFITLISLAHADWNKRNETNFLKSPTEQGWTLVTEKDFS
ncbi:MAG: hypothetical protein JSR85_02605 [Proteobacteria bacterium]|nr:hypothetical protein [Pseudomonadota bacterium]